MKSLLLFLSLFIVALGFAKIPEPQKNTYVNDYAHVLSKKQIKMLNERIRKFENKTTVQLAVVLVNNVPAEYSIDEFATLIGRRWHVGTSDNGLVYVLAIKQRLQRLEVARNLQATITDADAEQILDTVKANLRSKHYASAIYNIVEASDRTIANSYSNALVSSDTADPEETTENIATSHVTERDNTPGIVLGVFIVYLIIVYFYNKGKPSQGSYGSSNYYSSLNYNTSRIVNAIKDRNNYSNSSAVSSDSSNDNSSSNSGSNNDSSDSNYGNWGSSDNNGKSSSSSGFNGGGATSNW